jgi:23S rRNA (pseudouridine1915-N3)-methyltransferase
MKIKIITVGKIREGYLRQGIAEYAKRLGGYAKVELVEVGYEKIPKGATGAYGEKVKVAEGERLLRHISPNSYIIALDSRGVQMTSARLAETLKNLMLEGKSEINLLIGGPLGLSDNIRDRANLILSLSEMTFPHQLVSLIIIEQVYRAFDILSGGSYHK